MAVYSLRNLYLVQALSTLTTFGVMVTRPAFYVVTWMLRTLTHVVIHMIWELYVNNVSTCSRFFQGLTNLTNCTHLHIDPLCTTKV